MKKYFALGGRMTKWKGRVASVAPNLASVSVVAFVASGAIASAAVVVDPPRSSSLETTGSDDVIINDDWNIAIVNNGTDGTTFAINLNTYYTGTLDNSGSISVTGTSAAEGTSGVAIYTDDYLGNTLDDAFEAGKITNSKGGSITVILSDDTDFTGQGSVSMAGYGILVAAGMLADSEIDNAGTITVSGDASSSQDVTVMGISSELGSENDALVSNSGTILIDATGTDSFVRATGISEGHTGTFENNSSLFGTISGDVVNSGNIIVGSSATGIDEIYPDDPENPSIEAYAYAFATGIFATTMRNGSIDNTSTGVLTVTATNNGSDGTDTTAGFAMAHGIWVIGGVDQTSTISTTGSIDVTAYGYQGADATATGIGFGSTLVSAVIVDDVTPDDLDGIADFFLDGTLTIGGDVTASAFVNTPDSGGNETAIALADGVTTLLAGSGSIIETDDTATVTAIASADGGAHAWANGFLVTVADGTMTLGGALDVAATTSYTYSPDDFGGDAIADGVLTILSFKNTALETTGTIDVTATAQDGGVAHADGVLTMINLNLDLESGDFNDVLVESSDLNDVLGGVFGALMSSPETLITSLKETNLNGTITIEASGESALAVGALSYLSVGTLTTNNGTIDVTANAWEPGANDPNDGLFGNGMFNDVLSNGDTNLNGAVGMGAYLNVFSGIVNTGEINVDFEIDATNETTSLNGAAGIGVMANLFGLVANTGTINASATDAVAAGIAVAGNSGFILNSGTINAEASGEYGQAIGVFVDGTNSGLFINTGKIVALDNGENEGIAIYGQTHVDSGDDYSQLVLATGGFIEGRILVSGEANGEYEGLTHVNVQGTAGSSINWTVEGDDANALDSYFNTVQGLYYPDDAMGTTVFMGHVADSGEWQFTTIDSSQFAAQRESMADASGQSASVQASQTEAALASDQFKAYGIATQSKMTYSGTGTSPITVDPVGLFQGLFSSDGIESFSNVSGGTLDRDVTTSSLSAGGTMKTDGGLAVGFGIGGQSGDATMSSAYMTSSETSYDGAFAGVSVAGKAKDFTFSGGLTFGTMNNSYDRWANNNLVVGGIDRASGDYTSTYVTAQAGAAGHFKLGYGITVSPGVTLRYTNGQIDAYSETGDESAAFASVAEQSFGIMESQFDLNVQKALGMGSLNANLSVARRALGNTDSVDVTMVGDEETVSGFTEDTTTKTMSIGYSANLATGLSLSIEASRPIGSDAVSGTTVGGGLNFAF